MANITDQQVASTDSTEGTAPAWFDQGGDFRQQPGAELVWLEESATLARRGYIKALARSGSKDPAEVELEVLLEEQPKLRPWEHYIRTGTPLADGTPSPGVSPTAPSTAAPSFLCSKEDLLPHLHRMDPSRGWKESLSNAKWLRSTALVRRGARGRSARGERQKDMFCPIRVAEALATKKAYSLAEIRRFSSQFPTCVRQEIVATLEPIMGS